jgi:hypothetical protein
MRGGLTVVLACLALCGCRAVLGIDDVIDEGPPPDGSDLPPDGVSPRCPPNFAPLGSGSAHVYLPIAVADDYAGQVLFCMTEGPGIYLAIPDDQAELDAMVSFAGGFTFWIGIDDRLTENVFVTTKNQPATFLPWAPNEPSGGIEDCVEVLPSGEFDDDDCTVMLPAACECEP